MNPDYFGLAPEKPDSDVVHEKMKKKTAISLVGISVVLIVSHFLVWRLGYLGGHTRMGKLTTKLDLPINMRTRDALISNDLQKAKDLVEISILMNADRLRVLIADPKRYYARTLDWQTSSDAAYRPHLEQAEAIKTDIQSSWQPVTTNSDGRIQYMLPSLKEKGVTPVTNPDGTVHYTIPSMAEQNVEHNKSIVQPR